MDKYLDIIRDAYTGYAHYLWKVVTHPGENFFYYLIGLSIVVYLLEIALPWRKGQRKIRKDFWLDVFYMFFNVFLFSLIIHNALSMVFVELFNDFLALFGWTNIIALEIHSWPVWLQYTFIILLVDFVQWNTHRLLHRVPFLWEFHKLHHSVKEMGFSAHLRFHWMESILYKTNIFIALSMVGFGIEAFFYVHVVALLIGHLNHANLNWDYGIFKYILNNPKMHIWHHAKELPNDKPYGVNFGISFSFWDYIFKTDHVPSSGRDIELGFDADESFPKRFMKQIIYPFVK